MYLHLLKVELVEENFGTIKSCRYISCSAQSQSFWVRGASDHQVRRSNIGSVENAGASQKLHDR